MAIKNFTLTRQGQEAFAKARTLANDSRVIQTENILLALTQIKDSSAGHMLFQQRITSVNVSEELARSFISVEEKSHLQHKIKGMSPLAFDAFNEERKSFEQELRTSQLPLSKEAGRSKIAIGDCKYFVSDDVISSLELARQLQAQRNLTAIESSDIVFGMIDAQQSNAFLIILKLLLRFGWLPTDTGSYHDAIAAQFTTPVYYHDGRVKEEQTAVADQQKHLPNQLQRRDYSLLDDYGRNLTEEAQEHKLQPVIGRQKELGHLALILNRRNKNNALLIGPAGVGKTAIVEGLAMRIAEGKLPLLSGRQVIALDPDRLLPLLNTAVSSSVIHKLIAELRERRNVILFIDEIQLLRLAGGSWAINELKPALARGDLQLIGATTPVESQYFFHNDEALARRFETIAVAPLAVHDASKVVQRSAPLYENYYHCNYTRSTLQLAVDLAEAYLKVPLPDSALTILDNAGALTTASAKHTPAVVTAYITKRHRLIKQLTSAKKKTLNEHQINKLQHQLDHLTEQFRQKKNDRQPHQYTMKVHPQQVISATEMIIDQQILPSDIARIQQQRRAAESSTLTLAQRMKEKVIGQDAAINKLTEAIALGQAGLNRPNAPVASFFFAGLTGTGKTETAKVLATEAYGSPKALIRFNMEEFVGILGGAIQLANRILQAITDNPKCILLFDEFEKASPDIRQMLLGIMDDGSFLPSLGIHVDFSQAIIIMTSNVGAKQLYQQPLGFNNIQAEQQRMAEHLKQATWEAMHRIFSPEFLNRLTATVIFNPLTETDLARITQKLLKQKQLQLRNQGIRLQWNTDLVDYLVDNYADQKNGARPIQRGLDELLSYEVAVPILKKELQKGDTCTLTVPHNKPSSRLNSQSSS